MSCPYCDAGKPVYNWDCDNCCVRHIRALRSPDNRVSVGLQKGLLDAIKVKRGEATMNHIINLLRGGDSEKQ